MNSLLKILAVAGVFGFAGGTYAMDENALSQQRDSDFSDVGEEEDESVQNTPLVWNQDQVRDRVDAVFEYIQNEDMKVFLDGACSDTIECNAAEYMESFFAAWRDRFFSFLADNAGEEELEFTRNFADNPFVNFLKRRGYFRQTSADGNVYLLPTKTVNKEEIDALYADFVSEQ